MKGLAFNELKDVQLALMEGVNWLQSAGLIAPVPGERSGRRFITRRGKEIESNEDFEKYKMIQVLPRELLHFNIRSKVLGPFLRGDYDHAVFQAYKAIEVEVREYIQANDKIGPVPLMRDAFNSDNGKLSDPSEDEGQRKSLEHIFAGVMGYVKNPQSHRHHPLEPNEAVELIVFASHLMKIVEHRKEAE